MRHCRLHSFVLLTEVSSFASTKFEKAEFLHGNVSNQIPMLRARTLWYTYFVNTSNILDKMHDTDNRANVRANSSTRLQGFREAIVRMSRRH